MTTTHRFLAFITIAPDCDVRVISSRRSFCGSMNSFELSLIEIPHEVGAPTRHIRILIDGMSLIGLVSNWERVHALREHAPALAGNYGWPPDSTSYLATLVPGSSGKQTRDGRVTLLDCPCCQSECWPLSVRISEAGRGIVWSDFRNEKKARGKAPRWDYSGFGPFRFSTRKYLRMLYQMQDMLAGRPGGHHGSLGMTAEAPMHASLL